MMQLLSLLQHRAERSEKHTSSNEPFCKAERFNQGRNSTSSGRRASGLPKYSTKKETRSEPVPDSSSYAKAIEITHLGWLRAGVWVTLSNVGTAPKLISKIISLQITTVQLQFFYIFCSFFHFPLAV